MGNLIKIVGVALLLVGAISCGIMRYNECRRYHPTWYCLANLSK